MVGAKLNAIGLGWIPGVIGFLFLAMVVTLAYFAYRNLRAKRYGLAATFAVPLVMLLLVPLNLYREERVLMARYEPGKALFEERCRTVAGEKIYRRVQNVEGIQLLKLRPQSMAISWSHPMAPGAAFPFESGGDGYIRSFLASEHPYKNGNPSEPVPITRERRGYISIGGKRSDLPGYRYVDYLDEVTGKRYRYTEAFREIEVVNSILIGGDGKKYKRNDWVLERVESSSSPPRYAVTFEDHVIPEERALGVASSTVKVIDTTSQEVLGEMTRYSWTWLPLDEQHENRWLRAAACPLYSGGTGHATRKFVDQVLVPVRNPETQ